MRKLVFLSTGLVLLTLPAMAQYETIIAGAFEVGSAIYKEVSQEDQAKKQQKIIDKLDQIDTKLDKLTGMTQEIINDLKRLRLDIAIIVESKFEDFVEKQLRGDLQVFSNNKHALANFAKSSESQKSQIEQLVFNLERDTFTLQAYGPVSYHTVFGAIMVNQVICHRMSMDKNHQRSYFSAYEKSMLIG